MTTYNGATRPNLFVRIVTWLYRSTRFFFAAIGIFCTILPIGLLYMIINSADMEDIPGARKALADDEKVLLNLKLSGKVLETEPSDRFELINQFLGSPPAIYLPDAIAALERAGTDARVKGVFMELSDLNASLATVSELRDALMRFKAKGKPVFAYMTQGDTKDFYLASAADKIDIAPAGGLEIPGPVMHLVYFNSALNKLGVEFQVVRAGKFKSAFEPLIANEPSEMTVVMYKAIEESLRGHYADTIGPARQKTSFEARAWLKRGLYTAQGAQIGGLVDNVSYPKDREQELIKELKVDRSLKFSQYTQAVLGRQHSPTVLPATEKIALIEASGEMILGSGGGGAADDNVITPNAMAKAFQWARDDDSIKAVVFRISSPGGSALAADLIWDEVQKTKMLKPVVVSMGATAASGGYYVAAPASRILAEPTTITGSIGVISGLPKLTGFKEKWGVNFHTITGTDRSALYNPATKATPEDEAIVAAHVDTTYKMFVEKVAAGRKMTPEKVYEIAEGRVYTGIEALKLGLIDALGGYHEAVQAAVELAKLDPLKQYPMAKFEEEESILTCLKSISGFRSCMDGGNGAQIMAAFTGREQQGLGLELVEPLRRLERLAGDDRSLMLVPELLFMR